MRQWYAVRRLDKELLPPAQAMLDFLGEDGFRHLPAPAVLGTQYSISVSDA
jgi:hypothetical protein